MAELAAQAARVFLSRPVAEDGPAFVRAMQDSRGLHHPWVAAPVDMPAWRRYLERLERANEEGYLVRRLGDREMLGVVNLNVITYEALCSAYLSYYVVAQHAGRGYMKEGLQCVIDLAFGSLGLHRLEANIQPDNERSIRLVESLGFECEGYSPRFLMVNGKWRDHERWALRTDS